MKVYEYRCDTDAFKTIATDDDVFEIEDRFQQESLESNWKKIPVWLEGKKPAPDLLQLDYRIPVLTERAHQSLNTYIDPAIERLELACENCPLWALNLIQSTDSLIEDQSDIRKNQFGNIIDINFGVFHAEKIANRGLFTIKRHGSVFITHELFHRIDQERLTGLRKKEIGKAI